MADLQLPADNSTGWGDTVRELINRSNRSEVAPYVMGVKVVTGTEARPAAYLVVWDGGTEKPDNMQDGDWWAPLVEEPEVPVITAPTINTVTLAALTQGTPTNQNLSVTGTSPIMWTVTSGTLPAGLNLSSTGILSGTPTGSGAYSFTATATNQGGSDAQAYTGTITASGAVVTGKSVFGSGTDKFTFTKTTDSGTIRVANGFYTYGGEMAGWKVKGMRLYVPENETLPNGTIGYLFTPALGSTPTLSAPTQTVNFGPLTTGWNDIAFPTPVVMTAGTPVWIGYQTTNGSYVGAADSSGAPFIAAHDGTKVVLMDDDATFGPARMRRSYYSINGGAVAASEVASAYGVDILVEAP